MGTLQTRLDRIKSGFVKQAPAKAVAVMSRATEELRAANLVENLPAVGTQLPAFALPGAGGALVRSDELLTRGPLVVSLYRGGW